MNKISSILLASLSNHGDHPNFESTVKKCVSNLHSHLSKTLNLPPSILSVLPILLTCRCPEIVCRCAEIVGEASLHSLQMNEQIALDDEILRALVSGLRSCSRRVSMAACDAMLDLSTTLIGRQRLLDFSGLERLIIVFLQVAVSSTSVSLFSGDKTVGCTRKATNQERLEVTFLQAIISLINTCNIKQLENFPRKLSENFSVVLKNMWRLVHSQKFLGDPMICAPDRQLCITNITVNNLAESIFRLCASTDQFAPLQSVSVKRRIFGWSENSFENFMLHNWEVSPLFLRRTSESCIEVEGDDIFSSFTETLNYKELSYAFLSPMLRSFISCLPIESDEIDILKFLAEERNELGCPIIYQQDIRVLRTDKQSKREVHFFHETSDPSNTKSPYIFSLADITKCEEAYREGYTIALRGLEFRFPSIAAVADTLASLFGQPSVGANLYLTPPNSQGLARHYDDHCVFVCQLYGNKSWTVFSEPSRQLPRLYDHLESQQCLNSESSFKNSKTLLLSEGDVLYIPRGFAHEACTENTGSGELGGLSLHVTFGIEVEPPFEWAGFAHVALHSWNQTRKQVDHICSKPLSGILNVVTIYVLHAMIELIGASDPTFRKACLVAALSLPSDRNDWLCRDQKTVFHYLINKINTKSSFLETLRILEVAIQKKEDLLLRLKWLELLNEDREVKRGNDLNIPFTGIESLFPVYLEHKDHAEAAFMQIKTKFCNDVSFEDTISTYKMLFEKYKKARKHYLNGMLSLHCN
ncbi:Bifunctional lysine-specific demethylase and histidyl-hydroxylase NO66 [Euphorbia peplus]|nr:Bifunctional lysine-specific demethylase and histidyl-hydroxylase NO66 [Euphorbia peplus]